MGRMGSNLSVCVLDGGNVGFAEGALDESKHQGAFADTTSSEDHDAVVIALLGHDVGRSAALSAAAPRGTPPHPLLRNHNTHNTTLTPFIQHTHAITHTHTLIHTDKSPLYCIVTAPLKHTILERKIIKLNINNR